MNGSYGASFSVNEENRDAVGSLDAQEEAGAVLASAGGRLALSGKKLAAQSVAISAAKDQRRLVSSIDELDVVLGGGIVAGSVNLLAGPPGIGIADIDDPTQWMSLGRGAYDWGYDYAPTPHVNGRTIGILRGKVLGARLRLTP